MLKRTREEWETLVKEWQASGKPIRAWCGEQQIHPNSFKYWIAKGPAKNNTPMTRNDFTEIQDTSIIGKMTIEWRGCKIQADSSIALTILETCLNHIQRISC